MKFICYIDTKDGQKVALEEEKNAQPEDEEYEGSNDNLSEESRRRFIENNIELMNGSTIVVTSDVTKIPKYFIELDNFKEIQQAVIEEFEEDPREE